MKARLIFDLDNIDDRVSHQRILKTDDIYLMLWDIQREIRQKTKYGNLPEEQYKVWEEIGELFYKLLNQYKIDLDE